MGKYIEGVYFLAALAGLALFVVWDTLFSKEARTARKLKRIKDYKIAHDIEVERQLRDINSKK